MSKPEHELLEELVEAVGEMFKQLESAGHASFVAIHDALAALMKARATPPPELGEAPEGMYWLRHEEFRSLRQSLPSMSVR